jgi:hypothetical protein
MPRLPTILAMDDLAFVSYVSLIQSYSVGAVIPAVQWPEHEAELSATVYDNMRSFTSMAPCVLVALCLNMRLTVAV